jgi:hypothetical protein
MLLSFAMPSGPLNTTPVNTYGQLVTNTTPVNTYGQLVTNTTPVNSFSQKVTNTTPVNTHGQLVTNTTPLNSFGQKVTNTTPVNTYGQLVTNKTPVNSFGQPAGKAVIPAGTTLAAPVNPVGATPLGSVALTPQQQLMLANNGVGHVPTMGGLYNVAMQNSQSGAASGALAGSAWETFSNDVATWTAGVAFAGAVVGGSLTAPAGGGGAVPGALVGAGIGFGVGVLNGIWDVMRRH